MLEAPVEQGDVQAGNPLPIGGAHQYGDGVNFVLFSRHATRVPMGQVYGYRIAGPYQPQQSITSSPFGLNLDPVRFF